MFNHLLYNDKKKNPFNPAFKAQCHHKSCEMLPNDILDAWSKEKQHWIHQG